MGGSEELIFSVSDIDNFFTSFFENLRESISWTTFLVLLSGILIGFVICSSIYGLLMISSLKKEGKKEINIKSYDETFFQEVKKIKKNFQESTDSLSVKERFELLPHTLYEAINKIASLYYPHSKYPLYELSIEELTLFLRYLSMRIEHVFDKPFLKLFKKMTITQILNFIDMKKKINENKIVKSINNPISNKAKTTIGLILNYANPVFWFKKLVMNGTVNLATRKICLIIIDIVCDETNKTYSKAIFNEEKLLLKNEIHSEILKLGDDENERNG